jgi:hemoglobin
VSSVPGKSDLTTEADIKFMVDSFYDKVNQDDLLDPVFNDVAKINWDHHLPRMYNFWNTILFSRGDYKGSPYQKHEVLPVFKDHFDRWLKLFGENMDEHFEGKNATEAKNRANVIGISFWYKMGSKMS